MAESGIGSGLGLDSTAPVGEAAPGQNEFSPRGREREPRRRAPEPEKSSAESTGAENATAPAAEQNPGEESERPPHRIDSLA